MKTGTPHRAIASKKSEINQLPLNSGISVKNDDEEWISKIAKIAKNLAQSTHNIRFFMFS